MAEIELKTSIILDKDGKPFVVAVEKAFAEAEAAGTRTSTKLEKNWSRVFSTGALVRIIAAGYALRRLGQDADVPSAALARVSDEVGTLTGKMGTELQAAIGQVLQGFLPLIRMLTAADGSVRGLALGFVGLVAIGPSVLRTLTMLGAAAAPAALAVTAVMLGIGAAIGAAGERAAENAKKLAAFKTELLGLGEAALKMKIQEIADAVAGWQSELERLQTTEKVHGDYALGYYMRHSAQVSEARDRVSELTEKLEASKARLQFMASMPPVPNLTPEDRIRRWDLAIATGAMNLAEVHKQINEIIAGLEANPPPTPDFEAWKKYEESLQRYGEARENISDRETESATKQRTEVYNRAVLEAQITDWMLEQGPLAERQVVLAELLRLKITEGGVARTRILELEKQYLELGDKINAAIEERRQAEARAAEEKRTQDEASLKRAKDLFDAETARAQFRRTVEITLLRIQGVAESELREKKIRALKDELLLTDLSIRSLREKADWLENEKTLWPELDRQKAAFGELLDLLREQREESQRIPAEFAAIGTGLEQASQRGSLAMVQMFTRGRVDAKSFSEDMVRIFEQMIAEMLGKQAFQLLLSILMSIFSGGGAAAGGRELPALPDFIPGFGGVTSIGGTPRLPSLPTPGSSTAGIRADLNGLARRLDRMNLNLEAVTGQTMTVGDWRLEGTAIKGALVRVEAKAAARKLG